MRIQNNGLGVQSTTVYLLAHEGKIPPLDHSIFADTQEEPEAVYKHLDWLRTVVGPVIHVGTAGRMGDHLADGKNSTGRRFASIPAYTAEPEETRPADFKEGMVRRQCTKEYKVDVIEKIIRRVILGLRPRQPIKRGTRITQVFGISWDERVRAEGIKRRFEKIHWAEPDFPLIDMRMTRDDCKAFLKPRVPHEVQRSACVFCPFKRASEWIRTKANPKEWERVLEIDRALRTPGRIVNRGLDQMLYLHRQCIPLEMVDLEAEARKEADRKAAPLFDAFAMNDCGEGMCGV